MFKTAHTRIAHYPTPISGLALGIASLGGLLEANVPMLAGIQLVCAVIAMVLIIGLVGKFSCHKMTLWQELSHPVVGSVIPTSAMTVMLLTVTLSPYHPALAQMLWHMAVALHLVFLMVFAINRLIRFRLNEMLPSWFVPPVGLIMSALTFPTEHCRLEATALLYFGLLCYAVMFPVMLYRLLFRERLRLAVQPTLAILAAPPSLCLAGYLTLVEQPQVEIVSTLLILALSITTTIYIAFWHLLRLPFTAGYAAFSFPVVVSATALFKAASFFQLEYPVLAEKLAWLAEVELAVAAIVVSYVTLRFIHHYVYRPLQVKLQTVEKVAPQSRSV